GTRGRVIHIAEVDCNGANVGARHDSKRQSIANDWSHRRARRPVQSTCAGSEEREQFLLCPGHGRGVRLVERGRDPAIDHRASIGIPSLFAAERITGSMAAATITQRFSEISSAIPFVALCGVGLEASAPEQKNLPPFLESADT